MTGVGGNWPNGLVVAGRYTITSLLGAGGMGEVYRAWDGNLDTDVVIKVPLPEVLRNPEFLDRFDREIRSLVKLAHPAVVRVTDCGAHQGLPFAVMMFLPGGSLKDQTTGASGESIPQSPEQMSAWLLPVAKALDFIHTQNFIHRDVKPANILFDAHGNAYLSDFGIAKVHADNAGATKGASLTAQNMVLGTPEYMAPELIMGQDVDGRIDQYALAVTVFEVLCGQPPFQGQPTAVLVMHTGQQPPPMARFRPDLSVELEEAVLAGMAKSADHRFASCVDFAKSVIAAAEGAALSGPMGIAPPAPPSPPRSTPASGQRRQTMVAPAAPRTDTGATRVWSDAETSPALEGLSSSGSVPVIDAAPAPPVRKKTAPSFTPARMAWAGGVLGTICLASAVFVWAKARGAGGGEGLEIPASEMMAHVPVAATDPEAEFRNSLGMTMVGVSSGKFALKEKKGNEAVEWALVRQPFWISSHEVTVAQYFVFLESEKEKDRELHRPVWLNDLMSTEKSIAESYAALGDAFRKNPSPIVGIRRENAEAFCQWLNEKEGARQKIVYRLPTRDEWTCAFRAGKESRFYWGNELTGGKFNGSDPADGQAALALVGGYPANPWGLFDMAGNAREMVSSPIGVIGGGWTDREGAAPSLAPENAEIPAPDVGFRVVAVPATEGASKTSDGK